MQKTVAIENLLWCSFRKIVQKKARHVKPVKKIYVKLEKKRIRRAGEKIKTDSGILAQDLDIGFRVI
jgi:hypothetical protein